MRTLAKAKLALICMFVISNCVHAQQENPNQATSTAAALDSIFNPQRATERKSMGLLQRSFLDLVEDAQPKLEIAIVVDGTDSMTAALNGVRSAFSQMAEDLARYKDRVSFQVVVFRDVAAASGEISFPLNISNHDFTSDITLVQKGLASVAPESGAPFFHELIDLGVHEAITKLNWSTDPDVTRWILIFGDAPPLSEQWDDEKTKSRRRYSTQLLVTRAREKGIRISCVLCESHAEVEEAYTLALTETRQFMSQLANETDGLMLDLSYDNIRDALAKASQKPRPEYQETPINTITKEDVQRVRDDAERNKLVFDPHRQTRLAILPYAPLQQISFDPDRPEVQFATELRYKLRQLPGVSVKSPRQVEQVLIPLRDQGVKNEDLLKAVADRLRVDYLMWGKMEQGQQTTTITPLVVESGTGKIVTFPGARISSDQSTAGLVASNILKNVLAPDATILAKLNQQETTLLRPVSHQTASAMPLMGAFEALEQCTAVVANSPESVELLRKAKRQLDRFLEMEDDNALAHYLLANYHYNQALAANLQGQKDVATESMKEFVRALRKAYGLRNRDIHDNLETEIEGMYELLVRKDVPAAIKVFQSLTEVTEDTNLHFARRAHWMLAGIYAGDWGVSTEFSDPQQLRSHLIHILGFFESSPEADFIRQSLRWDSEDGKTQFRYLPHTNQQVTNLIET
ncbi:MAG: VWA domain-containing protein [Planctomycetales bacterium]|nr:VWA domain-containing protein [Planctomycetales bacterium]